MSLILKLWFAILMVIVVAILGSVVISSYTSKQSFEEQLFAKNMDNANMLALTMSTMEKSEVNIEMFIGSQFDIGHYAAIRLIDNEGEVIAQQVAPKVVSSPVPYWFSNIFEPEVSPGVAQVAEGWNQYASLYVQTSTDIAIEAMWLGTLRLFIGLFMVGIICGVIGSLLLRAILLPLKHVVEQAEALGEMQFIQIPTPSTSELRRVVMAMNAFSSNFKRILKEENQRLDLVRNKSQFDSLTQLANREYFLSILDAQLSFRDAEGHNCLILINIHNFKSQAIKLAPDQMDTFISKFAKRIKQTSRAHRLSYSDVRIGRLSEPDFAVLITEVHELEEIVAGFDQALKALIGEEQQYVDIQINISAVALQVNDTAKQTIGRAQKGILEAVAQGVTTPVVPTKSHYDSFTDENAWREALNNSIDRGAVQTLNYPVMDFDKNTLHYQAWAAVELGGELRKSGYYTHWARSLKLLAKLELAVVKYLLKRIENHSKGESFAVLVSESFILNKDVLDELYILLNKHSDIAKYLHFEVRESTVADNAKPFREFCQIVKTFNAKIGLKRVGESFSQLMDVQEIGLDYVKIDSAFIHNIHNNEVSQAYIRGFASLAHSFNIKVYADGVKKPEDSKTLQELGCDGEISNYENLTI